LKSTNVIIISGSSRFGRNVSLAKLYGIYLFTRPRVKPKFHLARHVTSRYDTTRNVRHVEPMHFGCVKLVEQHGSTRSSRRALHVERVESCRDITWRAKWNLGLTVRGKWTYIMRIADDAQQMVRLHLSMYQFYDQLRVHSIEQNT